ncbi:MAG: DsbA family protein [bacterium]|nr:DsbA family protein [bacterium]
MRGDSNAEMIIVEYGDFECPFCKRFSTELKTYFSEYTKDVQHVYRHFPLDSHPLAYEKAHASECVAEIGGEGAFWTYHDMLFARADENGQGISMQDAEDYAVEIGISRQTFADCQRSNRHEGRIESDTSAAIIAGITGTPSSIILGPDGSATLIPGVITFEDLAEITDYFDTL